MRRSGRNGRPHSGPEKRRRSNEDSIAIIYIGVSRGHIGGVGGVRSQTAVALDLLLLKVLLLLINVSSIVIVIAGVIIVIIACVHVVIIGIIIVCRGAHVVVVAASTVANANAAAMWRDTTATT